jgi:site-specific recombinase XerD
VLEQGTDLRFIQELLGHARSKTTEICTNVTKQSIAAIRSPIDQITITKPTKDVKSRGK